MHEQNIVQTGMECSSVVALLTDLSSWAWIVRCKYQWVQLHATTLGQFLIKRIFVFQSSFIGFQATPPVPSIPLSYNQFDNKNILRIIIIIKKGCSSITWKTRDDEKLQYEVITRVLLFEYYGSFPANEKPNSIQACAKKEIASSQDIQSSV